MGNGSETSGIHSSISKHNDIIFGVVYSLFGFFSLTGNSMLLLVAYQKKSMLKPAEFFIVNLAVSDLGMTITLFPLAIPSLFAHRWLFDEITCNYYAFCGMLFGLCSLTNLTLLSVVCCMKVCYPSYGNKFSSSHSRILILCVWAYAFVFATAPLADWGSYGPEPYGTACCIDWKASNQEHKAISYTASLFVFCYIIPCSLILGSYTLIFLMVKGSRNAVRQHLSPQYKGTAVHSLIVKLSVAVCIGFLLAWTPYAVIAMWSAFGDATQVPPIAFALAAAFAKSSTLYNPMVYLLLKPNFLNVLTQDLSVFQTKCAMMMCGSCKTSVGKPSSVHMEPKSNQGTNRSGDETFECFAQYPRCCNVGHIDVSPPVAISIVKNPNNGTKSALAVHLVVYSSSIRSEAETMEDPLGSSSDFQKDFV
uniref:G-protein coupled receptors family 1 profile domain-containing protein n=1 Tax=Leptobrachium leishanense TaxID=445787 RepID=A0A8C5R2P3_9ANUR